MLLLRKRDLDVPQAVRKEKHCPQCECKTEQEIDFEQLMDSSQLPRLHKVETFSSGPDVQDKDVCATVQRSRAAGGARNC